MPLKQKISLIPVGTHFDADVVQAFLENESQFLATRDRFVEAIPVAA